MTKRDVGDYFQDIVQAVNAIEEFVSGMNFEQFSQDRKTMFAVTRAIEIIGEATKQIPSDFKQQFSDVPWKNMAGMRDKLIHQYFGVDTEVQAVAMLSIAFPPGHTPHGTTPSL
ncbi:MAG: HepT-like ribonuclease domain-containing protein [Elainellaceae cyanobacterium]